MINLNQDIPGTESKVLKIPPILTAGGKTQDSSKYGLHYLDWQVTGKVTSAI
jgi:hypothetical protein